MKQYIQDAEIAEQLKGTGYKTANAGAFVMMNVDTGAVIAMGSYPNFDPNDFVLSMYGDKQAQEQLEYYLGIGEYEDITSEDMPLWNRAIMSQYAPGSTFKVVTASAMLSDPTLSGRSFTCTGSLTVEDGVGLTREINDAGTNREQGILVSHGQIDLRRAFRLSCNNTFASAAVHAFRRAASGVGGRAVDLGTGCDGCLRDFRPV